MLRIAKIRIERFHFVLNIRTYSLFLLRVLNIVWVWGAHAISESMMARALEEKSVAYCCKVKFTCSGELEKRRRAILNNLVLH
jgi:uncharacterized membrane protein YGL010W